MTEENPTSPPVEGPETPLEETPRPEEVVAQEADALGRDLAKAIEREAELVERLKRLQADFENFRRRSREDAALSAARGKEAFVREMLPVIDNLARAIRHAKDDGLRLIARQLDDALKSQGVEIVDPKGETFDAARHEAIARTPSEEAVDGIVLDVAERGYLVDGRLLRPARVVVAEAAPVKE